LNGKFENNIEASRKVALFFSWWKKHGVYSSLARHRQIEDRQGEDCHRFHWS
jgi:hypothetical protein